MLRSVPCPGLTRFVDSNYFPALLMGRMAVA